MFNSRVGVLISASLYLASCEQLLDKSNFDEHVASSKTVSMVEFYSEMCGSCQEFAPTWNKLAKNVAGQINTFKVNIDKPGGQALAEELGVLENGIPNVQLFNSMSKGKSVTLVD